MSAETTNIRITCEVHRLLKIYQAKQGMKTLSQAIKSLLERSGDE